MGLFSFSSNKKTKTELVCDIGSGSVALGIVELGNEITPKILYTERISLDVNNFKNSAELESSMGRSLSESLIKVLSYVSAQSIKISHISCFYSSPWFLSETRVLKLNQKEPFFFKPDVLKKMLAHEEKNFSKIGPSESSALDFEDSLIIERQVTHIKLNGYETHNPFNKRVTDVEASIFVGAISSNVLTSVEDYLKRIFRGVKITHHTFPLTSFVSIRNLFEKYSSFVILDISGENTDVTIVNENMLLDTMSYPLGKKNIVRHIEQDCGLDYSLASSALSMYVRSEINSKKDSNLSKVISEVEKDWLTHFENTIVELSKKTPVPSVLCILADEDVLPFFENVIKKNQFGSHILSGHSFQVISMNTKDLDGKVIYDSSVHKDLFIGIESLYVNTLSKEHNLKSKDYIIN